MAVALAAILGEELHIYRIREKRDNPGLRPQHLEAVLTAAKLCNAEVKGADLGSRELWFMPGKIEGGEIYAEIGTAGSIPMLLLTVVPMCVFAERKTVLRISKGGTDVMHSPTINYVKHVLLPMLHRMGVVAEINVNKYGYYPRGMGEVVISVEPCSKLYPINLTKFGKLRGIEGISVCTFLRDREVADRQAKAANQFLERNGLRADIRVVYDESNPLQKGSSLVMWAETDTGALLGADAIGELKKTSETVGREAAEKLLVEIRAKPTVDVHLADMLVPYVAFAEGESSYLVREMTEHLDTNIWLAQTILGKKFSIKRENGLYMVKMIGV